jgi:hypothetical protein
MRKRPKLQKHVLTRWDGDTLRGAADYLDSLGDETASAHAAAVRKVQRKLHTEAKRWLRDKGGAPQSAWTKEAERAFGTRHISNASERLKLSRRVFLGLKNRPSSLTEEDQRKLVRNHLKRYNDTLK